ncbi:aldolase [Pseudomonas sp. 02C 26]|uniref:aldolase catalytic domain-containing protein n=1 Tax=unclassified Pseudomonas TaxID=196821 RepID=UPI000C6D742B|nr:aldolase catalytic domain-containing protein [Pseudomonas sp. 02C 26]AUF97455.1 aldolase [Pseudomonas sp. 02C 26]
MKTLILDCTLRDGGYYNAWNFPITVINDYLQAMSAAKVDIVELGLRSLKNAGFQGATAFTTDEFIRSLVLPSDLTFGVMINASELMGRDRSLEQTLQLLFPEEAQTSPVQLVRIACHVHEFKAALPASSWLKERGFLVGFNLMQISDRSQQEVEALAEEAVRWPLDALYFADSMGSMNPTQTAETIGWLRRHWKGAMGIHTHDNMGMALQNTLGALANGVTWLDATVTGMGRGPGNAKTEQLALEIAERRGEACNIVPLMGLIRKYFQPMQQSCGWGTNTYYYLAGKYGIHPTYIQEMLGDSRYSEEDILAVIEHLRIEGGKKFSPNTLEAARNFYQGPPRGNWRPASVLKGREVLLLGTGPGVGEHRVALERYIKQAKPYVMALNTQGQIGAEFIDVRLACHPVRLLADCEEHVTLPQPLITPAAMLPQDVRQALEGKDLLDFGVEVKHGEFEFHEDFCVLPTALVIAYALAVSASGGARRILLAGFDGYEAEDPRNNEMNKLLSLYRRSAGAVDMLAITPTRYEVPAASVYGRLGDHA